MSDNLQAAYDEAFQAMFDGGNVTGSTARNLLDVLIAEARLSAFDHALAVLRDPHNVAGGNSAGLVELLRNDQQRQVAAARTRQEVNDAAD